MKTFVTTILILISTLSYGQKEITEIYKNASGDTLNLNPDKSFEIGEFDITGQIINEISLPPDCGVVAFGLAVEIKIIESNLDNYAGESIPVIAMCPEFFGDDFFSTGDIYKIKIGKKPDFHCAVLNYEIVEKYKLERKYWIDKMEKL